MRRFRIKFEGDKEKMRIYLESRGFFEIYQTSFPDWLILEYAGREEFSQSMKGVEGIVYLEMDNFVYKLEDEKWQEK